MYFVKINDELINRDQIVRVYLSESREGFSICFLLSNDFTVSVPTVRDPDRANREMLKVAGMIADVERQDAHWIGGAILDLDGYAPE